LKDPNLLFFEPRWKISYYQVKNESGGGEEEKIKDEEVPKTKKVKMKVNVGQSKKVIPFFNFFYNQGSKPKRSTHKGKIKI